MKFYPKLSYFDMSTAALKTTIERTPRLGAENGDKLSYIFTNWNSTKSKISEVCHLGSLLTNMFKSPESRVQTEALPPLDVPSHQLAVLCLNCLSHLFSWIPLSSTITPSLLSTIFHFAGFGCDTTVTSHGTPPGGSNHSFNSSFGTGPPTPQSLGVLAMCCINELLAKNCVPQEFEDFLLQMFQQTFYLLQRVTKETTTNSSGNRLQDLDER